MHRWATLEDGRVVVDGTLLVPGDGARIRAVARRWAQPIAPLASAARVPLAWALAVIAQESGGDPHAESPGGDVGLMQVRPSTAGLPREALLEWDVNARAGLALLGDSRRLGYDLPASASRYNGGASSSGAPHASSSSPWGMRETAGYITAVVAGANYLISSSSTSTPRPSTPPIVAPACRRALADADARWPHRARASDGIMGDAAHQRTPSDHNVGLAVDITHDPSGCRGELVAAAAVQDPRTKYVIWARHIMNPRDGRGWRPYAGANPHESHVHVSILPEARDDVRPWGWAPGASHSPASARPESLSSVLPLFLLLWRFVK